MVFVNYMTEPINKLRSEAQIILHNGRLIWFPFQKGRVNRLYIIINPPHPSLHSMCVFVSTNTYRNKQWKSVNNNQINVVMSVNCLMKIPLENIFKCKFERQQLSGFVHMVSVLPSIIFIISLGNMLNIKMTIKSRHNHFTWIFLICYTFLHILHTHTQSKCNFMYAIRSETLRGGKQQTEINTDNSLEFTNASQ